MPLDRAERWIQRLGGVASLVMALTTLVGTLRARRRPKGRVVGRPMERVPALVYVALTLLYVPLLVRLWRPLPVSLPRPLHGLALAAGTLLYFGGIGLVLWGRAALGEIYNVSTTTGATLFPGHRLITTGPFAVVRHPMYVGAIVASIGGVLLYRTWAMLVILLHTPVLSLRARREEMALAAEFGDEWRAYARRVPSGLPGLR